MQEIRLYKQKRASFVAKEIFYQWHLGSDWGRKIYIPHWRVDFIVELAKRQ